MNKKKRAQRIQDILHHLFPSPEIPLQHQDPYTLLIAVVLSAQNTDRKVNQVTPTLFEKASTPQQMLTLSIEEIAKWLNPMIDGWINYYGKFTQSALKPVARQINHTLVKWCINKYKTFRYSKPRAIQFMVEMSEKRSNLFAHWRRKLGGSFV